ncbi:hypothetical protein [Streptomyces sp. NPDC000880]
MRVPRGLVLAWAVLVIAGYGMTLVMDEPKEVNPEGPVGPQRPPDPTRVTRGCPAPPGAEREDGAAYACAVKLED